MRLNNGTRVQIIPLFTTGHFIWKSKNNYAKLLIYQNFSFSTWFWSLVEKLFFSSMKNNTSLWSNRQVQNERNQVTMKNMSIIFFQFLQYRSFRIYKLMTLKNVFTTNTTIKDNRWAVCHDSWCYFHWTTKKSEASLSGSTGCTAIAHVLKWKNLST